MSLERAGVLGAYVGLAVDWPERLKVLGTFESLKSLSIFSGLQQEILKEAGDEFGVGPVAPVGYVWLEVFPEEGSCTTLHLSPQSLGEDIPRTAGSTNPECADDDVVKFRTVVTL